VNEGVGIGMIVAGGLLAILASFWLWRRLPMAVAYGVLAASGAIVGTGALLVQDEVGGPEWAITLVALGVLSPMHARLLFGRPGQAS
jgi:hypothetical protein